MRSRFLALIGLLVVAACGTARAANEITCDQNPIAPGETVKLKWFFTGNKVVVSGGGFGKGVVVTGKTSITDKPKKTTRYTFTTNYTAEQTDKVTGKITRKPLKAVYSILIEVEPQASWLQTYKGSQWQVGFRRGWKRDSVPLPDGTKDGLVYFQPEDDALERMAVSMMPARDMTAEDLVRKLRASMPESYNDLINVSEDKVTFQGEPAVKIVFAGKDRAHPSTLSHTILMAFVKEGRAYVVSTRTFSAQYEARKRVMEKMLNSFQCAVSRPAS
jgi:hypothetical protein